MASSLSSVARPGAGNFGSLSPLVQSYDGFTSPGIAAALPRDNQLYTGGAFSPLQPINPVSIDQSWDGNPDHRPMPRRWQYPVGWNLPVGQPGTEGLKITSFATLRSFADMYSIVRSVIDQCIEEIIATNWDIIPTKTAELAMYGDEKAQEDFARRREQAMQFWARPDQRYRDWQSWMHALLEDYFVLDAMSLYLHPTRLKGHGPFNSSWSALDVIDGSTIRPLLDVRGGTPAAPNPAYEQYMWGVPRVDLMTPLDQQAGDDMAIAKVDEFKGDQLLYLPYETRDWTPYGFSHLERALVPVVTGFRRQIYALQYYDQGTLPAVYVTPGPDISTPQQIAMLQRALNNIAGDQAWKHKVIVLPPGSKVDPQKTVNLADQFDQVLAAAVTMVFAKTPMDIGMTPRIAAVQSPSETKEFEQINSENSDRRGLKPRLAFLKRVLFDYVMQQLWGQKDMEWHWPGLDTAEDQLSKLQYWSGLVKAGIASIDQAAQALGLQPWGLPETQLPGIQTAQGWVPLTGAVDGGEQTDELIASGAGEEGPADEMSQEIRRHHAQKDKPGERISGGSSPAHRVAAKQQGTHPQASRQTPGAHRPIANVLGGSVPDGGVRAKAAYSELDALARHIRKGRDVSTWIAKSLDTTTLSVFADVPELDKAVDVARAMVATKDYLTRRFSALADVIRMIAQRLGQLIYEWRNHKLAMPSLIDEFVKGLRGGYLVALNAGAAAAAVDHDDTPLPDFHETAREMAEAQREYAINLVHDLTNGLSAQALENRLALYGETLVGAYNMGYGESVRAAHPGYQMIWRLGDDSDHCDLCLPRAGQVVTWNSIPGWPGTGGFGGPVCEGGPRCHCWIEFVSTTDKSAKTPMYSVTHNPLGVEGLWHSKTLQLPAYIQQVARGIMESGYSRAEAIPMAVNAIKRWARGADHVHPEVIAASNKALAEWEKLRALPDKKDL